MGFKDHTGRYTALERKRLERRIVIIRELSYLSRNGWQHARLGDYEALEAELQELELTSKLSR